jgi:hypothetical protein
MYRLENCIEMFCVIQYSDQRKNNYAKTLSLHTTLELAIKYAKIYAK